MANYQAFVFNYKRTVGTDYFTIYGSGAARDTTTKDANSDASLSLVYPSGSSVNWTNTCANNFFSNHTPSWRKMSVTMRVYLTANPAADVNLFSGTATLYISTNGKLKINSTESSDAALSLNTWYTIEYIEDQDWNARGNGAWLCRQNGGTALQVNDIVGSPLNINLGSNGSKAVGPATTIKYNHLACLVTNDGTQKAQWLNAQTCEQDNRLPIANGTNNSFIGVTQTVNKYLNVADNPASGTDNNYGGAIGTNSLQGYTYTAVTYTPDTPRLYTIFNSNFVTEGTAFYGEHFTLIRDNGVNYLEQANITPTQALTPNFQGGSGRPADNSSLSSTILNAIEGGVQSSILSANTTGSITSDVGLPSADGATYDAVWTLTGGTAGSAYTCVNDSSDTTYITSLATGDKQGFTYSYTPVPATLNDVITRVIFTVRNRAGGGTGTNGTLTVGCRIGGVDYNSLIEVTYTTTWTDSVFNFSTDNANWKNPATGNRWTQSELTTTEFYIRNKTTGSLGIDVSKVSLQIWAAAKLKNAASFMTVAGGANAFTSNGNVFVGQQAFKINQAVNRGGTY